MKRILFLMLAFGLASTASAVTVSLTHNGSATGQVVTAGDTLTVQLKVSVNAVGSWIAPMDVFEGGSPDDGTLQNSDIIGANAQSQDQTNGVAGGVVLYIFELTVNGDGSVLPQMGSDDWLFTPSDFYTGDQLTMSGLTVSVVPEPVTLVLLGFGGLVLKRLR